MATKSDQISVSTRAELLDALGAARGGETIVLSDGDYGSLDIENRSFSSHVTITSANPKGAHFDDVTVSNSKYVRIDNVHVDSDSNGTGGSSLVAVTNGSRHVEFINSEVNGKVDGNYNGHYGLYSKESSDVTFANNYVHDVKNGGTFINTTGLDVVGNTIDYIGNDSFKFLSVTDTLILNNIGARHIYPGQGAHLDFIQFQGGDSRDVVIRGNVFLPETRTDVQGIFLDDAKYSNILIEQNIIVTSMIRGISISSATNVVARENTVLNVEGTGAKGTFVIGATQSYDNIMGTYPGHKSLGETGGNLFIQQRNLDGSWSYDDYFKNADKGKGITIADLEPVKGSLAETKGAFERIAELLNGG